jgi:hypothetical protein
MKKLLRYTGKDLQNIKLESWLDHKPKELRLIALKWFTVIQNCGKDVQSIFHDGYPMGCIDHAPFAYVGIFKSHVNVGFFYGTELPDKANLMEGTGKRMRHIKLFPDLNYDDDAIETLINFAYADIKQRLKSE